MSFQAPPRKKNALDNAALRLYAPNNTGKNSSFQVNLRKNNAQLTVWTNDPNDTKDNGKISVSLSLPYFYTFLEMLRVAARSAAPYRKFIEVKGYTFFSGKKSETPMVLGRLIVGRGDDGIVWVSLTAQGRPNIQFNMNPGGFNSVRDGDSSEVSLAELTQLFALGWCSIQERVMAHLAVVEYEEPAPRQQGGFGGGQGGGGRQGGYNGGGGGQGGGGGGSGGFSQGASDVSGFDGW